MIWVLLIALLILPGMVGCRYLPAGEVDGAIDEQPGDNDAPQDSGYNTGNQDER